MLKEMIRFYRKHRNPVYVCFLGASKAFDCVGHLKLGNGIIKRKCHAFITRLLMFWYWKHELCVKWNNVLSEMFSARNDIEQGGITSPKLFNSYANTLDMSLYKWKCCESSLLCRWSGIILTKCFWDESINTDIKMENSCRYLGHIITDVLDDNEVINASYVLFMVKQICYAWIPLLFRQCEKKKQLFSSYSVILYTCHLWCEYTIR